jgi:hypothetical protein
MEKWWWDSTTLDNFFGITEGSRSILIQTGGELSRTRPFTGGMTGHRHSDETRKKMSKSQRGSTKRGLHKGGKIMKDGVVVEFDCLSHICKELNLSSGHVCELLQGKRRSVKGWVKA